MWVAEVLRDLHLDDGVKYWVRGPAFRVGRSLPNHIDFSEDLCVSRTHAEIRFSSLSDGSLEVVDLGSRFGSTIDKAKLEPNRPYIIKEGNEVKFGDKSRIRFTRRKLSFCPTNVPKPEKDYLKKQVSKKQYPSSF